MIKLIVGLGNPDAKYLKTRHNAGFWLLDELSASWTVEAKFHGWYQKTLIANRPIHLLKPNTYMNASGRAVGALANFYQIQPEEILVVHDELDLPEGVARLKLDGGHGGHNGLRDIIQVLGTKRFYRLRIGIDRPAEKAQVVNYVLNPPNQGGMTKIQEALSSAIKVLPVLLQDGAEKAMHLLHSEEPSPK